MNHRIRAGSYVLWNFENASAKRFALSFDHTQTTEILIDHVILDKEGNTTICYFKIRELNIMIGIAANLFIQRATFKVREML
ncbi:hypothetical protein HN958_00985 [Candidatus Falkowbacteria bacterium]|jgi:hypothetical protein|nr:hypothetical protein [Candidatus Falkowbacteria bacterium]MBT7007065.1 hypothetical protein [Candidatus Falkowbacteria bacterium]